MLDYENEMLLDLQHEDGLLVLAKGMGLERILQGLIAAYNSPSNLVLIIGAAPQEAEYISSQLQEAGMGAAPRTITAEVPVPDRSSVYLEGGVLFVTSRILVVDLLMNRVPGDLITGIIVWKAHKILETCQEAFILRLYRQKNKTGFIKALSNSAVSFTQGFCHVGRVMRNLFVRRLFLYPRFHLTVTETLEKRKPEVVELHLRMTPAMQAAQSSLVDLVAATVHELRLVNKGLVDNDMLTPEWALSPQFDRVVLCLLQPVWEQLTTRTKHLVGDLRLLRTINSSLSQYDCITFYNLTSSLRTTEQALRSSGWMMLPPAEILFLSARKRVFGDNPSTLAGIRKRAEEEGTRTDQEDYLGLSLESNPKWECLAEVLSEVRDSAKGTDGPLAERCLIVTRDDTTAHQLQQVLVEGPQRVLQKLFYQTIGAKMNLVPPAHLFSKPEPKPRDTTRRKRKRPRTRVAAAAVVDERQTKLFPVAAGGAGRGTAVGEGGGNSVVEATDGGGTSAAGDGGGASAGAHGGGSSAGCDGGGASAGGDGGGASTGDGGTAGPSAGEGEAPSDGGRAARLDETITLTQIHDKYKFVGESSDSTSEGEDEEERDKRREAKRLKKEEFKLKDEEKKRRKNLFSSPLILVQSLKNYSDPFALARTLREVQPRYIVMYDSDLNFIRQLEVWQAESAPHQCLVYLMVYKGTTEEQLYLTQLKREKDAFHYLIKEKASLVPAEHAEGRTDDHPELQRDPRSAAEKNSLQSNADTRKGGGQEQEVKESRIIVDMREFRSELPSLIHKRGIEIDPVTIEVGDYILSPAMCVERKSLSDLVGSLNNGRLYSQAKAMTRHYTKPMLLIEFDHNKPFHLQASVLSNGRGASNFGALTQGEPDNRDVCSKLQLLTLHFPKLRLLWCSSPYATAEMFQLLKAGKEEPDLAKAQAIKGDSCPLDDLDRYNPAIHDFVCKLPGITTKNIGRVLRGVADLPSLLAMNQVALTELLGHSVHAGQLHAALHATLRAEDLVLDIQAKTKGKLTRKGLPKFGS